MHRSHLTPDSLETGYDVHTLEGEQVDNNGATIVPPVTLQNLQVKYYMRTVALGQALEYANEMPSFSERKLSDVLEMLKYVNNIVHVMEPHADLGFDLPAEVMEVIVTKLPAFLQMSWRELVKRGEGSANDIHRLREWLVKKATDKLVETIDTLEKNGFNLETVFKNEPM